MDKALWRGAPGNWDLGLAYLSSLNLTHCGGLGTLPHLLGQSQSPPPSAILLRNGMSVK